MTRCFYVGLFFLAASLTIAVCAVLGAKNGHPFQAHHALAYVVPIMLSGGLMAYGAIGQAINRGIDRPNKQRGVR